MTRARAGMARALDASGEQRGSGRARGGRGVALVEFAILLPVLAILVLGVLDLGRAYHLKNQLKNAAREGAIYGQTHPWSQQPTQPAPSGPCGNLQSIQARALAELQQSGQASPKNLTITVSPSTSCGTETSDLEPGDTLRVTAQSDFDLLTPLIGAIVGDSSLTIRETVEVEIQ